MFADFDKQLKEILEDNRSGSQAMTANISSLFKNVIIKNSGSPNQMINWLGKGCRMLREQHPDLLAVVRMVKKINIILESGLPVEYKLNSVVEALGKWDHISSEELNGKIYANIRELLIDKKVIVCHSQSATVLNILKYLKEEKEDFKVIQTVSYPACEGELMARKLAEAGIEVELIADSGMASAIRDADAALIGADSINQEFLINKQGTLGLCLAARAYGKPVYALADSEKVIKTEIKPAKLQNPGELSVFHHEKLTVNNTYFDFTPRELITGIATDKRAPDFFDPRCVSECSAFHERVS